MKVNGAQPMSVEQAIAHQRMQHALRVRTYTEPMDVDEGPQDRYIESAEVRGWAKSGRELSREERRILCRLQKQVRR